ncbi:hypothetical protein DOTSEDRAFT_29211 [Dothistroma septosporum NZE10]|uniref:Xylanolytic transcriptional activator regulatory domain-containing protein n=1 Tax=Dothistroma septosporum (strain NZE10 / CBS 128990) TaxID=675120 RepID=M2Y147_DOTSN|nr:hypothetical protein DOTSEDRAFT_29211 [Dothistroma septosporum NZE10]
MKTTKVPRAGSQALRDRIGRLEAIVTSLQHKSALSTTTKVMENHAIGDTPSNSGPATIDTFVAADFWNELTETVAGLRSVLDDPYVSDELDEPKITPAISPASGSLISNAHDRDTTDSHVILFGTDVASGDANPHPNMKDYLLDVYETRVDAIFKVLHWPTALSLLKHDRDQTDDTAAETSRQALASAISFAAVCSLMNHELDGRQAIADQYRRNAENAFVRAGLLTTRDFVTLQAFVIYLAGLRACQANAQQWTLTAVAIRLASALGLERPASYDAKVSPLDTELRRRLWFSIGILDMQSAFDRGSQPLLSSSSFPTFPRSVNDADIARIPLPLAADQFSQMSFSLLTHHAGLCQRRLTELGSSAAEGKIDHTVAGYEQATVLAQFEEYVQRLAVQCSSANLEPIQDFAMAVANESLVAMRLLLSRPLHKRGKSYKPPEHGLESYDLLATATEVLERSQSKRSWVAFAQWAWFSWVKWYALAVVLAELCCARGEQADRAWQFAKVSYDDYAKIVADTESGLLWKPIMKLMRKVQQLRSEPNTEGQALQPKDTMAQQYDWLGGLTARTRSGTTPSTASSSETSYRKQYENESPVQDEGMMCQPQDHAMGDHMSWVHWDLLIDDINDSNVNDIIW